MKTILDYPIEKFFTQKVTINGEEVEIIVPVIHGTLDLNTGELIIKKSEEVTEE